MSAIVSSMQLSYCSLTKNCDRKVLGQRSFPDTGMFCASGSGSEESGRETRFEMFRARRQSVEHSSNYQ